MFGMRRAVYALIFATTVASAAPPGETPPVEPPSNAPGALDDVHGACSGLARLVDSPHATIALSAKVSLASCEARERTRPIALLDCEQSARELEDAVQPSVQLLGDVIASNDLTWQIAAFHAMGEIYAGMAQRMLGSVPPLPPDASPELTALHDTREEMMRTRVEPWLEQARTNFAQVSELARQHPELAKDPVVAMAVRDSQAQAGQPVANR
jgi:hypothetical protein